MLGLNFDANVNKFPASQIQISVSILRVKIFQVPEGYTCYIVLYLLPGYFYRKAERGKKDKRMKIWAES